MKPFSMMFHNFGHGQITWADKFGSIWGILPHIEFLVHGKMVLVVFTIYKKLWFSGLTHRKNQISSILKNKKVVLLKKCGLSHMARIVIFSTNR